MLLWIVFACLTTATLAIVLRPLLKPVANTPSAGSGTLASEHTAVAPVEEADIAVYRDQLTELDHDVARGIIAEAEADLARREISRRLLRAAGNANAVSGVNTSVNSHVLAYALAAAIPLLTLGAYVWLGAPGVPSAPFAATAPAVLAKAPVSELIARVEQRLATNPADGQGWDVIGPVYLRLDRFQDAVDAFGNAIRLLGETTPRLAGLAEALVMASNGIVTEPARRAYEKLATLEPDRIEPKFWLLLAKEQDGKTAEAAAGYRALLEGAPPDADWRPLVVERLAAVTGAKVPEAIVKQQPERGPSAGDVKAAASMSDADRAKMIAGMVDGLAQRLKSNGNDPAGWTRLVSAYLVLGEKAKAEATVAEARRALAGVEAGATAVRELEALLAAGPRNQKATP